MLKGANLLSAVHGDQDGKNISKTEVFREKCCVWKMNDTKH
jgi:hypothetical protein